MIPEAAVDPRLTMEGIIEQMVRSVFLDCPEGVDSAMVASNVTRALWDSGYRQMKRHNHMTRDFREGCPGCKKVTK